MQDCSMHQMQVDWEHQTELTNQINCSQKQVVIAEMNFQMDLVEEY